MRILDTKILPKEKREKPSIKVLDKLYEVDNTKKTYDKKALKEILDLDISNEEYKNLVNVVVAAATGQKLEEIEQTTEKK